MPGLIEFSEPHLLRNEQGCLSFPKAANKRPKLQFVTGMFGHFMPSVPSVLGVVFIKRPFARRSTEILDLPHMLGLGRRLLLTHFHAANRIFGHLFLLLFSLLLLVEPYTLHYFKGDKRLSGKWPP
jgi:hypothetical protein